MHWFAGTSGYSYKSWRGSFYPQKLASGGWLSYYGQQLPTVEINNTFYRMPRSNVIESWRDAVPENFRFSIKASRRITHQAKLKDAEDSTRYLLDKLQPLEHKLGAVLFQLPKWVRMDMDLLQRFQDLLPDGLPAAFEFRHASWLDDGVFTTIRERGHALVAMDDGEEDGGIDTPVCAGAWCYLRLRSESYSDEDLSEWNSKATAAIPATANAGFVFFKHEDDGVAPQMAQRFLDLTTPLPARRSGPIAAPRRTPGDRGRLTA